MLVYFRSRHLPDQPPYEVSSYWVEVQAVLIPKVILVLDYPKNKKKHSGVFKNNLMALHSHLCTGKHLSEQRALSLQEHAR